MMTYYKVKGHRTIVAINIPLGQVSGHEKFHRNRVNGVKQHIHQKKNYTNLLFMYNIPCQKLYWFMIITIQLIKFVRNNKLMYLGTKVPSCC